jgi:hypothetical protein
VARLFPGRNLGWQTWLPPFGVVIPIERTLTSFKSGQFSILRINKVFPNCIPSLNEFASEIRLWGGFKVAHPILKNSKNLHICIVDETRYNLQNA